MGVCVGVWGRVGCKGEWWVCGEYVREPIGKCWGKEVRTGKVVRERGGVGRCVLV